MRTFPHECLPAYVAAQRFRILLLSFESLARCPPIRRQLDRAALRVMVCLAEATVTSSEARKRRVLESAVIACAKCAVLADAALDSKALSDVDRGMIHDEALRLMHALNKLGYPEETPGEGSPGAGGSDAQAADFEPPPLMHGPLPTTRRAPVPRQTHRTGEPSPARARSEAAGTVS